VTFPKRNVTLWQAISVMMLQKTVLDEEVSEPVANKKGSLLCFLWTTLSSSVNTSALDEFTGRGDGVAKIISEHGKSQATLCIDFSISF
jgi:hypothetical protein